MKRANLFVKILQIIVVACLSCRANTVSDDETFASFVVNPTEANVEFFWRDDKGEIFKSIENLKNYVEKNGKHLRFAMNGGMYQEGGKPLGLFVENRKIVVPLNTREGAKGNFYIKPNGVFYITTDKRAFVTPTEKFKDDGEIEFATQSGPMLVVAGIINPEFTPNSENINVRNGVCVLENNHVLFAISRRAVNFYDFAEFFKKQGCRDALYLDGFVSRMFLPEKNIADTDGDFGVMIGVTE